MNKRSKWKFGAAAAAILLLLVVAFWTESPPEAPPWTAPDGYSVKVLASRHSVSRFWRCGWDNACPQKLWRYCLKVVPDTTDAAIDWYRRYHSQAFYEAAQDRQGRRIESLAAMVAQGEAELGANTYDESTRAEKIASLERLKQKIAERTRFGVELVALDSGDPAIRDAIVEQTRSGLYVTAEYTVSRAGLPQERHSGYYYYGGCRSDELRR